MQELVCSEEKKKKMHKAYMHTRPAYRVVMGLFLLAFLLFNGIFICCGFLNQASFLVMLPNDSHYGEKDMTTVWLILAAVNFLLIFFWMTALFLLRRITGTYFSERINESLTIEQGKLIYGYQNYSHHSDKDRVLIKIPFSTISRIEYQEDSKRLRIFGQTSSIYYEDYRHKRTRAKEEYRQGDLILYDYFSPSLYLFFKEKKMHIAVEKREKK